MDSNTLRTLYQIDDCPKCKSNNTYPGKNVYQINPQVGLTNYILIRMFCCNHCGALYPAKIGRVVERILVEGLT